MTFKEYKLSKGDTFNKQRNKIYRTQMARFKNSTSESEAKKLEEFLNGIFYPKDKTSGEYQKRMALIAKAFEEKTGKKLSNFNLSDEKVEIADIDSQIKIFRDKYEAFSHKHYIETQTLQKRFDKIKNELERLNSLDQVDKTYEKVKDELNRIAKEMERLLKKFSGQEKIYLDDEEVFQQIQKLDEAFKAVSTPTITPEDFGDLLEIALGILDSAVQDSIDGETDVLIDLLENSNSAPIKGGQRISGDALISLDSALSISNKDKAIVKRGQGRKATVKMGDITIETDIPKAGASRQGKIDVLLNLKNISKTPFRISAKNWLDYGDFGEVPLSSVLERTVDSSSVLEKYIYAMGLSDGEVLTSAHNMAKFSILMDTLVGYSQENNWVDTLIINKRGKGIIVEHIPTLVKNCYDDIDYKQISYKYNSSSLETGGRNYYKEYLENIENNQVKENSLRYKTAMISLMGAMHVSAKYHAK